MDVTAPDLSPGLAQLQCGCEAQRDKMVLVLSVGACEPTSEAFGGVFPLVYFTSAAQLLVVHWLPRQNRMLSVLCVSLVSHVTHV